EVNDWTRRDVLAMLAAAAWTPLVPRRGPQVTAVGSRSAAAGFRVRTITAGTSLKSLADTRALDAALGTLKRAKQAVTDAGYEVQTVRIATQPVLEDAGGRERASALIALQALDRAVVAESVLLSVGPVLAPDGDDPDFAAWAAELAHTTKNVSFTVRVASPERGTSPRGPLGRLVRDIARRERRGYTGIDVSPAPGKDASIGATIEALTGVPFGAPSTLAGCAAITDVLKSLRVKTCGYSGLMLPVLEDPVLARRASEGRYSVRDLLLYSTVCGTGLDVVPLPGDTPADRLAALIADVAALSAKLRKPLSARLFPVPG